MKIGARGRGGEAGVQLRETDGRAAGIQRQKDDGLVVLEALMQEAAGERRIAGLAVELAIGVEKRDQQVQIASRGLPHFEHGLFHAHDCSS